MGSPGKLIVGLGNPVPEYRGTRHNAGAACVDRVVERTSIDFTSHKCHSMIGEGSWRSRSFAVASPQSYMNRSGEAVRCLLRHYRLEPRDMLVVYDDINLPLGAIRARADGGAGGHNGIEDIIEYLGTKSFPRLRIGIGNDFPRGGQSDYVLSVFESTEEELVAAVLDEAALAALSFVTAGIETTMRRHNKKSITVVNDLSDDKGGDRPANEHRPSSHDE